MVVTSGVGGGAVTHFAHLSDAREPEDHKAQQKRPSHANQAAAILAAAAEAAALAQEEQEQKSQASQQSPNDILASQSSSSTTNEKKKKKRAKGGIRWADETILASESRGDTPPTNLASPHHPTSSPPSLNRQQSASSLLNIRLFYRELPATSHGQLSASALADARFALEAQQRADAKIESTMEREARAAIQEQAQRRAAAAAAAAQNQRNVHVPMIVCSDPVEWRSPPDIYIDPSLLLGRGAGSKEREIQIARERGAMAKIYVDKKQIPAEPELVPEGEKDANDDVDNSAPEIKRIPFDVDLAPPVATAAPVTPAVAVSSVALSALSDLKGLLGSFSTAASSNPTTSNTATAPAAKGALMSLLSQFKAKGAVAPTAAPSSAPSATVSHFPPPAPSASPPTSELPVVAASAVPTIQLANTSVSSSTLNADAYSAFLASTPASKPFTQPTFAPPPAAPASTHASAGSTFFPNYANPAVAAAPGSMFPPPNSATSPFPPLASDSRKRGAPEDLHDAKRQRLDRDPDGLQLEYHFMQDVRDVSTAHAIMKNSDKPWLKRRFGSKLCSFFDTPTPCGKGDGCTFAHVLKHNQVPFQVRQAKLAAAGLPLMPPPPPTAVAPAPPGPQSHLPQPPHHHAPHAQPPYGTQPNVGTFNPHAPPAAAPSHFAPPAAAAASGGFPPPPAPTSSFPPPPNPTSYSHQPPHSSFPPPAAAPAPIHHASPFPPPAAAPPAGLSSTFPPPAVNSYAPHHQPAAQPNGMYGAPPASHGSMPLPPPPTHAHHAYQPPAAANMMNKNPAMTSFPQPPPPSMYHTHPPTSVQPHQPQYQPPTASSQFPRPPMPNSNQPMSSYPQPPPPPPPPPAAKMQHPSMMHSHVPAPQAHPSSYPVHQYNQPVTTLYR